MSKAKFQEVHPVLPVRDVAAAIVYYTQKLGFELKLDRRARLGRARYVTITEHGRNNSSWSIKTRSGYHSKCSSWWKPTN